MDADELKDRTKQMSLDVFRLVAPIPHGRETDVIVRQIIRSSSSVAANDRSACKARSKADFINKIGIVEEEADETVLWLEYILDLSLADKVVVEKELKEVNELVAIFAGSAITAKRNRSN